MSRPPSRKRAIPTGFAYRRGVLHAEGLPLDAIAREFGTPTWVYASAGLEARYRRLARAFAGAPALICYALKANSNQAVIATFARLGAGADIVSAGELRRALAAGVPPAKIVFAGVGKTRDELAEALAAGILQFNVESEPELDALDAIAAARGRRAPVALRVNPDVDARTHAKITTGRAENKFGVDIPHARALARRALGLPGVDLQGLSVHIGSQLTSTAPYATAFRRITALGLELRGAGAALRRVDFGGGLGVTYEREAAFNVDRYAALVRRAAADLAVDIVVEPGRWLVAEAGVLLTRVIYMKRGLARNFAIVDAAMNDLLRPTLYEAWHPIEPVKAPRPRARGQLVDVVGPVCETGDVLASARRLPPLAADDLIAIGAAGAYGAVQSSMYNSRPLAAEVMVRGDQAALVRPRQSIEEMIALDRIAPWLAPQIRQNARPR